MKTIQFMLLILPFIFLACNIEPKPIDYGNDHCNFCDMTIVDKTHAAEYTTKKGKSFMYDAIECLVNDINEKNNENTMAFILVANYEIPGQLIDAKKATYLISKGIRSPMGANLSAFNATKNATKYLNQHGGKLYNWTELKTKFSK